MLCRHQDSAPGVRCLPGNFASMEIPPDTPREAERRKLREDQLQAALQKLDAQHQEERRALSQEFQELAKARKAIQDQLLWAERSSQQEDGAASSAATASSALLKELLPEKNERHVEVQRLLEILDKELLEKAYYRIEIEDPHEIKARQQTEAARRAGRWRFVSKERLKAERELVEREDTAQGEIDYVDLEKLGSVRIPSSYEEVKRLLLLQRNPIYSEALQEWNRKEQYFTLLLERRSNRVANLKNELYQLIGFFSVFQGVVLTAVLQSSLLHCHNKWSPIALSVLASVISTFGILLKLNQINDLQRIIYNDGRTFTTLARVGQLLRAPGSKGIDFVQLDANLAREWRRPSNWLERGLLTFLVALALVAFGVLFPISFWGILCNPGAPSPAQ